MDEPSFPIPSLSLLPNEEERKRLLEPLQDMVVRYVLRYGEITCTPDLRSAACWLPPGRTSLTDLGFLLAGALSAMLQLGRATLQRAAQIETLMSRQQKRIVPGPHWSLAMLAVDPPYQGQGLGSQLLRAGTARADAANLPCSLDTAEQSSDPDASAGFTTLLEYVQLFQPTALQSLRLIVMGGETFPLALARKALNILPETCKLYNAYGPTEATIGCAAFQVTRANLEKYSNLASVPIGKPMNNMQLYVLDNAMNPVPVNVAGELYIGGVCIGPGYLNQPELTAACFVVDPYGQEAGARLYKTGDLARYLPDGAIEFLGRIDDQVKFRGFRIELGEIEAVLREHLQVQKVVVILHKRAENDQQIIAYIQTGSGQTASLNGLRTHLKARLPEYMIPSTFIFMEQMPLTTNGKIDRKALPAPDQTTRMAEAVQYIAPRNQIEETVALIWSDIFNVKPISIQANFFELGGHSLLATQVVSRLLEVFHILIPIRSIFEKPTIVQLAAEIGDTLIEQADKDTLAELLIELES